MAIYSMQTAQNIPAGIDMVWDFFSDPANLAKITPKKLGFKILSKKHGDKMYAGQIIEYKVKPVAGIPVYWMTEITHVVEKKYFVDEQRFGPYALWHHQHHFEIIDGGVQMTDIVYYKSPLWLLGDIANALFVRKQLKNIFEYRFKKAEEVFGRWPQ